MQPPRRRAAANADATHTYVHWERKIGHLMQDEGRLRGGQLRDRGGLPSAARLYRVDPRASAAREAKDVTMPRCCRDLRPGGRGRR